MAVVQYQPKRRGSTIAARPLTEREPPVKARESQSQLPVIEGLVGDSPLLKETVRDAIRAASCELTVFIEGESGTGKELIAQAIHKLSSRAQGPFVAVNCSAVPHSLFESEFFGHERGAYTDARAQRAGLFEQANRGTLFLDEIGELPFDLQAKLLRVLQEGKVTRLGGRSPIAVDARVIVATNRDLRLEIKEKRFREDLFYRVYRLLIRPPALREHVDDMPLLVDHFINLVSKRLGFTDRPRIDGEALELLRLHPWPGNVRELEGMIERLVLRAGEGGSITPIEVRRETALGPEDLSGKIELTLTLPGGESFDEVIARVTLEIYRIVRLRLGAGHADVARWFSISRTALHNRLKRANHTMGSALERSREA
jgi:two-component system, NtrC family, nitrogen regulation response regulator GlnG